MRAKRRNALHRMVEGTLGYYRMLARNRKKQKKPSFEIDPEEVKDALNPETYKDSLYFLSLDYPDLVAQNTGCGKRSGGNSKFHFLDIPFTGFRTR